MWPLLNCRIIKTYGETVIPGTANTMVLPGNTYGHFKIPVMQILIASKQHQLLRLQAHRGINGQFPDVPL